MKVSKCCKAIIEEKIIKNDYSEYNDFKIKNRFAYICNKCKKVPCDIIDQPEPKEEDWETEFDKKFPNIETAYLDKNNKNVYLFKPAVDVQNIKDYIKQLLASQKQKLIEELKEEIEKQLNIYNEYKTKMHSDCMRSVCCGEIKACNDILSLLDNKLKP